MGFRYLNDDTITAVATGADAISAIGIVRISGPNAWSIAAKTVRKTSGIAFSESEVETHHLYRVTLVKSDGSYLDDGMFVWFKNPKSFTGEDLIEFHLHGNPLLLRSLVEEFVKFGARPAAPGEFSFRAFRSGKISLNQAESVSDLINSKTEVAAKAALEILLGNRQGFWKELKHELVGMLAEVEVDIDFSDQGLSHLDYEKLVDRLNTWRKKVELARASYLDSVPLREGVSLSLVGEPNSGKSSLFNALLGEDRSIVSEEAGTTRDVVSETLRIGSTIFRLSDTAGIRDSKNAVENVGIQRSWQEAARSSLSLWVLDGFVSFSRAPDQEFLKKLLSLGKVLAVWNKSDLAPKIPTVWCEFFEENKIGFIASSASTGAGLGHLKAKMVECFATASEGLSVPIGRSRHYEVLGRAVTLVEECIAKIQGGERLPDLLAGDLRCVLSCLAEVTGEVSSDDVLNHIFSEFCIGK